MPGTTPGGPTEQQGLVWDREDGPRWDEDKQRVIGSAPAGSLDLHWSAGDPLPGDWWVARTSGGVPVGYGWLDATWGGDAEILLAVDASAQGQGVGSFVLDRLESEASRRGLNYVYNTVRSTHPQRDDVHDWLAVRGYRGSSSDTTLRKRVGVDSGASLEGTRDVARDAARDVTGGEQPSWDPVSSGDRGPGQEESGGYVDIDEHRY